MRKFLLFLLLCGVLFAKNVLIINSYSVRMPWTRGELNGILKKIGDRADLKIFIEFMDTKIFRPTPKRIESFYDYLKNKYEGMKFDIVIATDDNALNFVREYRKSSMFSHAKIFFCGINNLSLAEKLNKNEYAGVFEKKEPLVNLSFLKQIVPNLKTIYVVADASNSGKEVIKEAKKAFKGIKSVRFVYIDDKHLEEVLKKIKKAPKNSAMMLLTPYSFYLQGSHIDYKYAIALISHYFPHPIAIHTDILADIKNSNIVGGKVTDSLTQGETVGEKVLKYLDGAAMNTLGFTFNKANKMYLNVKNLEKFGIDAFDLRFKNVIYVNKPDSFFELYKEWIISFSLLLLAVLSVSVILFLKNRQLAKYNVKMSNINVSLEEKIKKSIEEIKDKDEMLSSYKEEAYRRIIKNILFRLKYPIDELYKYRNEIKKEEIKNLLFYLKTEINGFEKYFNEKKENEFSVKGRLLYIKSLLEDYFKTYGIEIAVKGGDFSLKNAKRQFDRSVLDILSKIKEIADKNSLERALIEITVKNGEVIIELKADKPIYYDFDFNKDFDKKWKKDLFSSKIFFENCVKEIINYQNDKNSLIFELKFTQ